MRSSRKIAAFAWVLGAVGLIAAPAGATVDPAAAVDYQRLLQDQVSMLETLDRVSQDLQQRRADLDKLQAERQKIAVQLIELEVSFEDSTRHLSATRELIRKRLRAVARYRRSVKLDLVFSIDDYFKSQRRERVIGLLLDEDKDRIETFKEELTKYGLQRATLDAKREQLDDLEERVAGAKAKLDADQGQREEILRRISERRSYYEKAYQELEAAYKDVTERIRTLSEWRDKQLSFGENQGKLRLPMSYAAVVTGYGPQKNKKLGTTVMHRGLEIKTTKAGGTRNVRAVYWGRVAFVGWLVGYGETVILDHTGGYHTLYARLAKVNVKEGDVVETRGLLGQAGGQAALGTPGTLYFELRHQGKAIDPTGWFM